MDFEWNDTKRKSNIKKHGIDFINAPTIFDGYTLTIEDCFLQPKIDPPLQPKIDPPYKKNKA